MTRLKFALCRSRSGCTGHWSEPGASAPHHHWHGYAYGLPYPISYLHNYGPGPEPGTFAYYDGPSNNFCYPGCRDATAARMAAYPCF